MPKLATTKWVGGGGMQGGEEDDCAWNKKATTRL